MLPLPDLFIVGRIFESAEFRRAQAQQSVDFSQSVRKISRTKKYNIPDFFRLTVRLFGWLKCSADYKKVRAVGARRDSSWSEHDSHTILLGPMLVALCIQGVIPRCNSQVYTCTGGRCGVGDFKHAGVTDLPNTLHQDLESRASWPKTQVFTQKTDRKWI